MDSRRKEAVAAYAADYTAYFERNNARVGGGKKMLDPMPRVFYVEGVGLLRLETRRNPLASARTSPKRRLRSFAVPKVSTVLKHFPKKTF